jgi:carboxymethylenebutenolidase
MMAAVRSVTKEAAARDTEAMLAFLADQPEVADGPVGTTGYCMGGGLSLDAAGRFRDRVGAAASFHGGNIATEAPDSPHRLAGSMQARVYVAAAENDGSFGPDQEERLRAALEGAGVDHTIETYPAAHGFAVPDNPTYDEAAAERHWQALEHLYGSTLTAR